MQEYSWHHGAMSMLPGNEADLLRQARTKLQKLLGAGWEINALEPGQAAVELNAPSANYTFDEIWLLEPARGRIKPAMVLVETKLTPVTPRAASELVDRLYRAVDEGYRTRQEAPGGQVLVVAPWISARSREVLEGKGVGYLDLTGNVDIRISRPAVVIRTDGARQSPFPEQRSYRGLSGPRAGRLVRELVDFGEPRMAAELVERTEISQGYVSKLLDTMTSEALIKREGRMITEIDWKGLLRSRASSYHLMRSGFHVGAIARRGRPALFEGLRLMTQDLRGRNTDEDRVIVTGSFVAEQVAPLAVGGPLYLYVPAGPHMIDEVSKRLRLLRVDQVANSTVSGADVIMIQPPDRTPFLRPQEIDGIPAVGYSQLVLDCLSGPGRMPAEGEAVLEWMDNNLEAWRDPSPLT